MKITIDGRSLIGSQRSGIAHYTLEMLQALSVNSEHQLTLVGNSRQSAPTINIPNITICWSRWPNKVFNSSQKLLAQPKLDQQIATDILWLPNINFAAWDSKTPTIVTVHDLSFLRFPEFFSTKMRLWHWLVNAKKLLRRATAIIAVSEQTKQDLIELLNVSPEKITVIYEGVSKSFQPMSVSDPRCILTKIKYSLPDKFLLYLGTLEPRKNIEGIIEAAELMKCPYPIILAGGKGWKSQRIIERLRQSRNVRWLGYVEDHERLALYNLATAFVYPSFYEGFGLPLVESMACGTPVIAGANSSQVEVVADAGLLVDPFNAAEIAQAIDLLIGDEQLYQTLKQRGIERAAQFTWEKAAGKFLELTVTIKK
ncbi:MAG: glycosyltransferase family 4 protein [Candidatus Buchananbacteria bacterium]|nr:glycosyltransferase family 4 protein [Candidatus Buchananbacteria bacterium]